MLGSGYLDESELAPADKEFLDEAYRVHSEAVPGILSRWRRGMNMTPTAERIVGFLNGIYHFAFVTNGMDDESLYEWKYGDTVDHCSDCSGHVGSGKQPASYWRRLAASGQYPGSSALECTGLHCGCQVVKA